MPTAKQIVGKHLKKLSDSGVTLQHFVRKVGVADRGQLAFFPRDGKAVHVIYSFPCKRATMSRRTYSERGALARNSARPRPQSGHQPVFAKSFPIEETRRSQVGIKLPIVILVKRLDSIPRSLRTSFAT